jgi:probable poly-beta-1,6-N-acetyl-D-glucosamine export protein
MSKKPKETILSLAGTEVLKGIAILAVFLIHILSSLKQSPFVSTSSFQLVGISLDQIARISVPLFVALSGYGLALKYSKKKFNLGEFFSKRVFKILPLYVFWSIFFIALFYFVPRWAPSTAQPNFLWQLLLGRADYHLYFVPMIFQLYLLFPIILKFFQKWPLAILLLSIIIQLTWWWFFSYQGMTITSWKYFAGDGEQYLWMTNWLAYFVLGMYLPHIWKLFDKYKLVFMLFFVAFFGSSIYTIFNAQGAILGGLDPLYALKFTRYPLFVYSSLAIIVSSYMVAKSKRFNLWLGYLGKHSYFLYLSHTFFLRILFMF